MVVILPHHSVSMRAYFYHNMSEIIVSKFQRSSHLKPLGQSKPTFICSIFREGGMKAYINGPDHMTKMDAMAVYSKKI